MCGKKSQNRLCCSYLKKTSELQSPFCMFIYSHLFTCGVSMNISIAYPLCKYLSCVWGRKNSLWPTSESMNCMRFFFLRPPWHSTMQLCANMGLIIKFNLFLKKKKVSYPQRCSYNLASVQEVRLCRHFNFSSSELGDSNFTCSND